MRSAKKISFFVNWNKIQWILIPIIILFLFSFLFLPRELSQKHATWYSSALKKVKKGPVDIIFIGSSRVAASIDTNIVERILSMKQGRNVRVLNLGWGYSTLQEHYFGLRNLWESAPNNLKGCTVFIEAMCGLPQNVTWDDSWVHPDRKQLILDLLRVEDLSLLWQSKTKPEEKWYLLSHYFLKHFPSLLYRDELRYKFFKNGETWLTSSCQKYSSTLIKKKKISVDLTKKGGIRTDEEGIKFARKLAIEIAHKIEQNPSPIGNWWGKKSVLIDIINLVQTQMKGKVVLFEPPLGPVFSPICQTEIKKTDKIKFLEHAKVLNLWSLTPEISTTIEDFPDFWHLRKSRAPEFTFVLIKDWLEKNFAIKLDKNKWFKKIDSERSFSSGAYQTSFLSGWYDTEYNNHGWLRWSKGKGTLEIVADKDKNATLSCEINSLVRPNEVKIIFNGKEVYNIPILWKKWEARPIKPLDLHLKTGKNIIEFVSRNRGLPTSSDKRDLAFYVQKLKLVSRSLN